MLSVGRTPAGIKKHPIPYHEAKSYDLMNLQLVKNMCQEQHCTLTTHEIKTKKGDI